MIAPALLLPKVVALVDEAAAVVIEYYRGDVAVTEKADASPVTAADEAAERVLVEGLRGLTPELPVVAEEERAKGASPEPGTVGELFWLVDPLDGTKEFIKKNGEFTLNVGLIQAGRPILGVVAAPAVDALWTGAAGHGASSRQGGEVLAITARPVPVAGAAVSAACMRPGRLHVDRASGGDRHHHDSGGDAVAGVTACPPHGSHDDRPQQPTADSVGDAYVRRRLRAHPLPEHRHLV